MLTLPALAWNSLTKNAPSLTITPILTHHNRPLLRFPSSTVVNTFRSQIYDKYHKEEDADIILSTVHAAKGCEWDNVVVLDDLCGISAFIPKDMQKKQYNKDNKKPPKGVPREWQFKTKDYGDDLNLWYVALTRARKVMAVPPKFLKLFEKLSTWPLSKAELAARAAEMQAEKEMSQNSNGSGSGSQPPEAYEADEKMQKEIAYHLCVPWREKEMKFGGLEEGFRIYDTPSDAAKANGHQEVKGEVQGETWGEEEAGGNKKKKKKKKKKSTWYAVAEGKKQGVFTTWEECKELTDGFKKAKFKGFPSKEEAEGWLAEELAGAYEMEDGEDCM